MLGIHRWPLNSPHKWPLNAENVSIWWRHHDFSKLCSISHQIFPIFLKMTVYQNQYCGIIYTERLHVLWFNTLCEIRLKSTQYRYLKKKCCVYACQQPINITNTVVAPNLLLLIHIRVTICQMRVDKYLHDKGSKNIYDIHRMPICFPNFSRLLWNT